MVRLQSRLVGNASSLLRLLVQLGQDISIRLVAHVCVAITSACVGGLGSACLGPVGGANRGPVGGADLAPAASVGPGASGGGGGERGGDSYTDWALCLSFARGLETSD